MGSLNPPNWSAVQAQEYDAAQSMLQHSRSARSNSSKPANDYPTPDDSNCPSQPTDMQLPSIGTNLPEYATFAPPLAPPGRMSQNARFNSIYSHSRSPPNHIAEPAHPPHVQTYPQGYGHPQALESQHSRVGIGPPNFEQANLLVVGSDSGSIVDGNSAKDWSPSTSKETLSQSHVKEDPENRPAWADQKTKAGKERKRLPLACIACRRKKIRCSGEKPACKHCTRSRMPCVYKTSTRKAAPRTDYMAMLDRRLKRMEERVIKIIPKDEASRSHHVTRAVVKPSHPPHKQSGRKRPAAEMTGLRTDRMLDPRPSAEASSVVFHKGPNPKPIQEGAEHLPSKELQQYLSEIFFDYLHGQSYYLIHKPSYMRKLRWVKSIGLF